MCPPVPRGEGMQREVTSVFQCILLHTQHTIWSHRTSWLTEQEMHSEQTRFYIYCIRVQWAYTAARTAVTRSNKNSFSTSSLIC